MVLSSRTGSQRTSAICDTSYENLSDYVATLARIPHRSACPPKAGFTPARQEVSDRLSLRNEAVPVGAEEPQLVLAELREEAAPDAGDMRRARLLEQAQAGLRDA